jgi:hypothetical protein
LTGRGFRHSGAGAEPPLPRPVVPGRDRAAPELDARLRPGHRALKSSDCAGEERAIPDHPGRRRGAAAHAGGWIIDTSLTPTAVMRRCGHVQVGARLTRLHGWMAMKPLSTDGVRRFDATLPESRARHPVAQCGTNGARQSQPRPIRRADHPVRCQISSPVRVCPKPPTPDPASTPSMQRPGHGFVLATRSLYIL